MLRRPASAFLLAALLLGGASACDDSREMEAAGDGDALPEALEGQPREPLPPAGAKAVEETVRATAVEPQGVDEVTGYVDPVCQMKVEPRAQYTHTYEGVTYGFCSAMCQSRFEEAPADYLAALEE